MFSWVVTTTFCQMGAVVVWCGDAMSKKNLTCCVVRSFAQGIIWYGTIPYLSKCFFFFGGTEPIFISLKERRRCTTTSRNRFFRFLSIPIKFQISYARFSVSSCSVRFHELHQSATHLCRGSGCMPLDTSGLWHEETIIGITRGRIYPRALSLCVPCHHCRIMMKVTSEELHSLVQLF